MENRLEPQSRTESKARLIEQINSCLQSGDYPRSLDMLRGAAAEFPDDAELSELEKVAQDGIKRTAEAHRLITESQELFAQRKSAEAIQLLRKAYELDKRNSLARAILANALVEHANSILETDWLGAETLINQALALNPAHPTAKTIHSLIVEQKKNSSVEDWVAQAHKLQSSGDLFAALGWVAEGLAVHPDNHKLLQIQDAIQRDQSARRRQARRGDLEELRRMEHEIDGAADPATKQALADRIQKVAAKHWTDGEILSVANGLLNRLGLVPREGTASPRSKGATVIFQVPRVGIPNSSAGDANKISPTPIPVGNAPLAAVPPSVVPSDKVPSNPLEPQLPPPQAAANVAVERSELAAKVKSPSSDTKEHPKSNFTTLILMASAAIIVAAATLFFVRKHHAPPVAQAPAAAPGLTPPVVSVPTATEPAATQAPTTVEQTTPEPPSSAADVPSNITAGKVRVDDKATADSGHAIGTLLVVVGQDGAQVFLNGKLQPQLTQAGQLSLPNLELKDYVVQVSKGGFQDPPQQKIRIRNGDQARIVFDLQPKLKLQPRMASLAIQGGVPDTTVLIDQTVIGTIQPDGSLSVMTVNPGDHNVELRKDRFKPRQFKEHFVVGETISLTAADAALEAAPGELKITFAPADATVAIVKGELLKVVSSGVPLNLPGGTYTLTTRTAERVTRSSTIEIAAGQSRTLDLALAPTGMSNWDDPGAWKREKDSFIRKGGDFVLYGVVPASGTFIFSAMPAKSHPLQWVLNYSDSKNYILFQMDDSNFSRSVIRNGEKTDEIRVPANGDKKGFRTFQIRVSPAEIVHQIKNGDRWTVLDHWTQPGTNPSLGKFGFYLPGSDQLTVSSFAHYGDLNIR